MKIISKIKDYYDYLTSVYGIDEDIVYDRRECNILSKMLCHYFNVEYNYYADKKKTQRKFYEKNTNGKYHFITKEVGDFYYFCLEVGITHYIFQVERYKDENDKIQIIPSLLEVNTDCKKISDAPISLIPLQTRYGSIVFNKDLYSFEKHNEIINPILNETYLTSFINADDLYNNLYNYLMSQEKEIIDKRDDIAKLESHGFDKKISFRGKI